MSLMQRRKGRAFEQKFARLLRARFPQCEVRRSSQADRAYNSDVVVTGHPLLERIWWELTDARRPNVMAKLVQAERDVAARDPTRLAAVTWHALGERQTHVTMRGETWVVVNLRPLAGTGLALQQATRYRGLVTMELGEFLEMLTGSETRLEPRAMTWDDLAAEREREHRELAELERVGLAAFVPGRTGRLP